MELKTIDIVKTVVHARPGAEIGYCMREAVKLAVTEWRNIELHHNGRTYKICPNDIMSLIEPGS